MTWALEQLAKDRSGFDTAKLLSKIKRYKHLSSKVRPDLFPRDKSSRGVNVWIEPLHNCSRLDLQPKYDVSEWWEWLDFRFWCNRTQKAEDIHKLADAFNEFLNQHEDTHGLKRVALQNKSSDRQSAMDHFQTLLGTSKYSSPTSASLKDPLLSRPRSPSTWPLNEPSLISDGKGTPHIEADSQSPRTPSPVATLPRIEEPSDWSDSSSAEIPNRPTKGPKRKRAESYLEETQSSPLAYGKPDMLLKRRRIGTVLSV